jgi:hypothetical protein
VDTKNQLIARLCVTAYERGHAQGTNDRLAGYYNPTPLSGEWAGESPRELLGDLFDEAGEADPDMEYESADDIMASYEEGYADGNCD